MLATGSPCFRNFPGKFSNNSTMVIRPHNAVVSTGMESFVISRKFIRYCEKCAIVARLPLKDTLRAWPKTSGL